MLFLICFFRHFIIPISVDYQYVTNNQQDSREKIMMVVGACIFLAVEKPTGLNPLEIADNFVTIVICHFVIFKTKRGGPETKKVVQKYYQ